MKSNKKKLFEFKIELEKGEVPQINHDYKLKKIRTKTGKEIASKYLTRRALDFKNKVFKSNHLRQINLNENEVLFIEIFWSNPKYYTKKELISQKAGDIDCFYKFIQDSICDAINVNDSRVKSFSVTQLPSNSDKHIITTYVYSYSV